MLRPLILALSLIAAPPVRADVAEAVQDRILPGYAAFASAAADLAGAAAESCDPGRLQPAFHAAFDAWMGVAHLRLGPVEDDGMALAIAFWPDPKGLGAKAQAALLARGDIPADPAFMAEQSVAARGFMGLERLLWPAAPAADDACPLIRATAADLARMAQATQAGWQGDAGFAALLLTAGAEGNTRFLSPAEPRQALFTALITGFEHLADQRLGRPLGSFDKPRPDLAEARASGRSLRNIRLQLQALRDLSDSLAPTAGRTQAAVDHALALASSPRLDPALADIADPQARLRVEVLQQAVRAARDAALAEVGQALAVSVGFNAADGD